MDKISEIEKIIGYSFKDKDLLATAFTHSSYAYQYKTKSNENLEFLGDSILNFIVAELLYLSSIGDEGQMTEVRAAVVSRDPLAAVIRKSGLKAYIRYGTGCESQHHSVNSTAICLKLFWVRFTLMAAWIMRSISCIII